MRYEHESPRIDPWGTHNLMSPSRKIFAVDIVVLFQLSSSCLLDMIQSSKHLLCECHNNTI